MKMIFTTIAILALFLAWFAYTGGMQLTFKPFSIKFNTLYDAIGWVLVITGMLCFRYEAEKRGYRDGVNDTVAKIEAKIKEMIKDGEE